MSTKATGSGYALEGDAFAITDTRPGGTIYVGTGTPASPQLGDIWVDNASGWPVQTTKGDIYGFDGANPARVPVGVNGQALVSNSSSSTGLSWAFQADEIATIMGAY